jgi:hypothetical protein
MMQCGIADDASEFMLDLSASSVNEIEESTGTNDATIKMIDGDEKGEGGLDIMLVGHERASSCQMHRL